MTTERGKYFEPIRMTTPRTTKEQTDESPRHHD
jgi:hypothetical protein